jgi:RHS repeat-associated protein
MRVGKAGPTALIPTGAAYYVYDEEGKLLGEYDANGVPLYETIYLGVPVGVIKQTGTASASNIAISLYNVSTDQVGAPRIITRQSDEAIVWRWDSAEAFGATAPDQNPSSLGTFSFNQRFPGQVFDAESGLFQNWNREYNSRIGRYMQSDPIGLAGGANTFVYVTSDPLSRSDPQGLFSLREWWDASIAGFKSESPGEALMRGLQAIPGEGMAAGALSGSAKMLGLMCSTGVRATKAINLPGWAKVTVDMAHIAERHMPGGKLIEGRTVFVNLNEKGVEAAVHQAYSAATTISVQGDRVLLYGVTKTGMAVEMWLNRATSIIETAYPVIPR